jgi:hypothetical protein
MANVKQAYDWYQDGKKIRHKNWSDMLYVSKDGNNLNYDKIHERQIFSDSWELYKEPMSEETKEALREVYRKYSKEYGHHSILLRIIQDMGVDL